MKFVLFKCLIPKCFNYKETKSFLINENMPNKTEIQNRGLAKNQ